MCVFVFYEPVVGMKRMTPGSDKIPEKNNFIFLFSKICFSLNCFFPLLLLLVILYVFFKINNILEAVGLCLVSCSADFYVLIFHQINCIIIFRLLFVLCRDPVSSLVGGWAAPGT